MRFLMGVSIFLCLGFWFRRNEKRCKKPIFRVNDFVWKTIKEHREKRRVENNINGGNHDQIIKGSNPSGDVILDLEKEIRLTNFDMIIVLWVNNIPT